jgi:hypothetical protein
MRAGLRPPVLHVRGKSSLKHSRELLECWLSHPEWPQLVFVGPLPNPQVNTSLTKAVQAAGNIRVLASGPVTGGWRNSSPVLHGCCVTSPSSTTSHPHCKQTTAVLSPHVLPSPPVSTLLPQAPTGPSSSPCGPMACPTSSSPPRCMCAPVSVRGLATTSMRRVPQGQWSSLLTTRP